MKIAYPLIVSFFFCALIQAQIPQSIFDRQACGCQINKDSLNDMAYIQQKVNSFDNEKRRNALTNSFDDDAAAIGIINDFLDVSTDYDYNAAIRSMTAQLSQNESADKIQLKESLSANFEALAKGGYLQAKSKYAACFFSEQLHQYYLDHPNEAGLNKEKYALLSTNNNSTDTSTTINASVEDQTIPNSQTSISNSPVPQTGNSEEGVGTIWMILFFIAVAVTGGFAFMWNAARKKTIEQQNLNNTNNNNTMKWQMQLDDLKGHIEKLERENEALRADLRKAKEGAKFYQEFWEKQQNVTDDQEANTVLREKDPPSTKDHIEVVRLASNNPPKNSQYLCQYLASPTPKGVFYSNGISEDRNLNSIYELRLAGENDPNGQLYLIKDANVIQRAENMAQQLLLPVCELHGKGRIPRDLSFNQEPGILVKEGAGWRVKQKVVLKW